MEKLTRRLAACAALLAMVMSLGACTKDSEPEVSSAAPVPAATKEEPQPAEEPDVGEHKDYDKTDAVCYESGSIIVAEQDGVKRGIEPYTMILGSGCLEFYANELNEMKNQLSTKVKVYSMIVPTASELYCPANERYRIDSQADILKDVKDMLIGVEQVDVLPTLTNHNAEPIFYRTDSRWTPLGCYYAGKVFAKAAGVPYADISEYTPTSPKDYIGDFQDMSGPQAYADFTEDPDEFSFYAPKCRYTTNYYDEEFKYLTTDKFYTPISEDNGYGASLFDGYYQGGYYSLKIDTDVKNDRRLLIVKDDYGTAMPTFFTSSFSEIYVVSYDYLEANLVEMIDELKITDVLYLMNMFTVTDTRVYTLETLRTQATHGSVRDNAPDPDFNSDSDSDSDSDSSTDSEDDPDQIIYDIGINNSVGIREDSDEETFSADDPGDVSAYDENDVIDDGGYDEDDYYYDEEY